MSETKHTPGPWRIVGEMGDSPFISGTMPDGVPDHICQIIETPDAEDYANARLIAAAPDLLAALIEARSLLETAGRYFPKSIKNGDRYSLLNVLANSVNPAIAKAEGKGD